MQGVYHILKKMVDAAAEAIDAIASPTSTLRETRGGLAALPYQTHKARETVIVQDVSGSMGDDDYAPTRLDGGRQASLEYYAARRKLGYDDRISMVAFNHKAQVILRSLGLNHEQQFRTALQKLTADGGTDIAKGLYAASGIFDKSPESQRLRNVILLSDGHDGKPLNISETLKSRYQAEIDVVGIGGDPSAVDEQLLRQIATTDPDGRNHYRFIRDTESLRQHYRQLATGIMWTGDK